MNKAAFFDRDGTLIYDVGYLSKVEQIKIIPEMINLCKYLSDSGYELFVVTNQSGIARGYFNEKFVKQTHVIIKNSFEQYGINLKAFYYCPHHPEYGTLCDCRKPKPGMLLKAAKEFNLNLHESLMFGDKELDIQAGEAAGCKSFLMEDIVAAKFKIEV